MGTYLHLSFLLLAALLTSTLSSFAAQPLHRQIDALIAKAHPEGQAGLVNDADYLRRVYLALHGVIPSADKAREFFADKAPDKRAKLVDALLADAQFARWMAVSFDIMLMERRPEAHTKSQPWRDWLEESFKANKPWDALVREIVTADGADEKTRRIARWLLERQADPNALTKDVGRVFLGRDVSCSQCHDHPRIDDYLQRDYAGIQAFFARTYLFRPDNKKPAIVGEQVVGETTYLSVFTKVGGDAQPRLPGAQAIADLSKGEWLVAPDSKNKALRPIPKESRRALLASALGDGKHPAFRRNIANRLWAFVFGRGIVEPLDLQHSANPPSNPALLDLLAEQGAAMKFDMRGFVRELALTDAFQRSLDLPAMPPGVAQIKGMLPGLQQQATALEKTQGELESQFRKDQKALVEAQLVAEPTRAELIKLDAAVAAAQKVVDDAATPLKTAGDLLKTRRDEYSALLAEQTKLEAEVASAAPAPVKPEAPKPAAKPPTIPPAPTPEVKPPLPQPKPSAAKPKEQAVAVTTPAKPAPKPDAKASVEAKPASAAAAKAAPPPKPAPKPAPAVTPVVALKAMKTKVAAADRALAAAEKDVETKKATHAAKLPALKLAQQAADKVREKMKGFAHGIDELQNAFVALEARKEAGRIKARDAAALVAQLKTALAAASPDKNSEAREALANAWSRSFAANDLLPLTPEQLCWSALQATGQTDAMRKAAAAQYDAKHKPTAADKADAQKQAERHAAIEASVREKQRAFEGPFITAFGGAAGQPQTDFFATPEQALYFENGGVLRGWATSLATSIASKPDTRAMAEELYLSTLTRLPNSDELADVEALLKARPEKKAAALADYAWALVTSVEFRFSH
jgi:hypothetical protein